MAFVLYNAIMKRIGFMLPINLQHWITLLQYSSYCFTMHIGNTCTEALRKCTGFLCYYFSAIAMMWLAVVFLEGPSSLTFYSISDMKLHPGSLLCLSVQYLNFHFLQCHWNRHTAEPISTYTLCMNMSRENFRESKRHIFTYTSIGQFILVVCFPVHNSKFITIRKWKNLAAPLFWLFQLCTFQNMFQNFRATLGKFFAFEASHSLV
jgi:hypothetical protein